MYKLIVLRLEEDLIKIMKYRLYSEDKYEYSKLSVLMKEICDVLEEFYNIEKGFKKG